MEKLERKNLDIHWIDEIKKVFTKTGIPASEWLDIESKLKGLQMNQGEFLVHEGDLPHHMAFVVQGIFRAFYLTESGDEKTVIFRGKGKPLSAYSSFVKKEPAKFSIQALTPGILLYISIQDFEELLAGDSFWKIHTGSYLMDLFIEKERRERALLSDDAETRYLQFLEDFPGLIHQINHYYIASYLGISHVTLSRIRTKLNRLGNE